MFILRTFFVILILHCIVFQAKCDCKGENAQNGVCKNNKEHANLYEDEDKEFIEDAYKKYSAELNQENDDNDFTSNDKFCLPAEFSEAGVSKLSIIPTHKSRINYLEDPNPEIEVQKTIYNFGGPDNYGVVSEIESSHNSSQKINVTIDVCYPKEKNMEKKICPILGIEVELITESNEDNVKLISGQLYNVLEKGQQICVRIEANNTYTYQVAVNFQGLKKKYFDKALLNIYSSGKVTEKSYVNLKELISNPEIYEKMKLKKMFEFNN